MASMSDKKDIGRTWQQRRDRSAANCILYDQSMYRYMHMLQHIWTVANGVACEYYEGYSRLMTTMVAYSPMPDLVGHFPAAPDGLGQVVYCAQILEIHDAYKCFKGSYM